MTGQRRRAALALAVGTGVSLALAVADFLAPKSDVVISTVVLGPLLAGLLGSWRDVALVGVLATVLVLVSGIWNDNFDAATFYLRAVVVATGSLVAALASARRETVTLGRSRFALLSAAAEIGSGTLDLEQTAARVTELIVPAVADVCVIDVESRGGPRRLAVRASGPDREQLEARLAAQAPSAEGEPRGRSRIVVPLAARGRPLGTLTLIATERCYTDDDREFVEVLAGRVALALDNAGLFGELETIEAQLSAAMSGLAEAVTIQRSEGALIYANEAAARLLGFETTQELLAAPVERLIESFAPTHEDGTPIAPDEFPGRRLLAGEPAEPMVARIVEQKSGEERWTVTKATPVRDRRGRITLVVNVIEDITEVKRAERGQRLLARAGDVLASSLDYERTLQQVADLAVPALADWCAVSLPDGRGFIRTVAVAHRDPERLAAARHIAARYPTPVDAPGGVAQVVRDGRSLLMLGLTPEQIAAGAQDAEHARRLAELGFRGAMIVPITAAGRVLGALSLVSAESGRTFADADLALAEELARRAGTAVENARLYRERSRVARTLQAGLLPDALPAMPGWRADSLYRPAEAEENWVGGDFFDAVPVAGGWLVLVGDVAGRGADAAALTALARHTLRATAKVLADPLDAIGRLNEELAGRAPTALCTVAAALLRERDGRATAEVVCAGHPPVLLLDGDEVRPLGEFGPMLGAFADERWQRVTTAVEPGATLVLYTDGVLDTVGEDRARFGEERLWSALAGARDADEAIARVDAALRGFQVGAQADDTAVLAIQRAPLGGARRDAVATGAASSSRR